MKNYKLIFAIFVACLVLLSCEKGDPTALKEAVRLASLNISSITVEPADGTITTGYSYQFKAIGHQPDGSTTDVTDSVDWSSSNDAIATVDSNGFVATDTTDGTVSISASLSSLTGSTTLTASSAALQSIAIFADTTTPTDLSVSACKNLQLKAIGTYEGESVPRDTIPITNNVDWSVDDSAQGSISAQGLLSTYTDGSIGIQASLDGIPGPATVTANQDLTSISVTPANTSIAVNGTLQYTATGTYSDNSSADITENTQWSSDATAVAEFNSPDSNGLITGIGNGSAVVTAACGTDVSGSATLTVSEKALDYLRFEDDGNELLQLDTQVNVVTQITLYAYYTDNTREDVTENAQWSLLNNTGAISVGNSSDIKGEITALAEGTDSVKATYQQREKLLSVTVTAP